MNQGADVPQAAIDCAAEILAGETTEPHEYARAVIDALVAGGHYVPAVSVTEVKSLLEQVQATVDGKPIDVPNEKFWAVQVMERRAEAAEARITELETEPTYRVYLGVSSTGDGMPTGTWKTGEPQPEPTVDCLGDPSAVRGLMAIIERGQAAEARVTALETELANVKATKLSGARGDAAVELLRRLMEESLNPGSLLTVRAFLEAEGQT